MDGGNSTREIFSSCVLAKADIEMIKQLDRPRLNTPPPTETGEKT